ncbi:MAG: twin-arginine translocation signal domain-containing protein [Betaproteobacteria bacterium]|nr:twin-arginine translocation signal domain-containing protein [Betaproteobacteria bacterium]MBV9362385.1 twin-arginine translocation signal domain-containing protein [Betaproteobacteria bacterium]
MSERTKKLSRRNFLLTLGAGGAATAAAVVATKAPPASKPAPASRDKRATRGYQETAHTSNYYRTTKV